MTTYGFLPMRFPNLNGNFFVLLLFLIFPSLVISQSVSTPEKLNGTQSLNRFSVGVSTGVPVVFGISVEGVTPLFNNRLAVNMSFGENTIKLSDTGIKINTEQIDFLGVPITEIPLIGELINQIADEIINTFDTRVTLTNFEFGLLFYLKSTGSGWYGKLNGGILKTDYVFEFDSPLILTPESVLNNEFSAPEELYTLNLRIGYKTKTRLFVKGEVGISLVQLPRNLSYVVGNGIVQQRIRIEYPNLFGKAGDYLLSGVLGVGYRF